jgi:peptide/nickel transport system substrate-binding protein
MPTMRCLRCRSLLIAASLFCCALLLANVGCNSSKRPAETTSIPFKLGDLIDPFTPPTLEELDAQVKWVEKPVSDSMELLRKKQVDENPLVSVEEALALRNTSPETNKEILSGLGRLPASQEDVDWDAEINRHSAGDVNSNFPLFSSSVVEFDVQGLVGVGLFSFDWKFDNFASKDSVVSWHSSDDGLYDKVVMRKDMTWSDGKPITAHDVVYSFQAIMTKAVPVKAVRQGTDKLKWVEAYDDYTLVFFHKEPLVTNVQNLNFSIIPKHIFEKILPKDPTLKSYPDVEDNPVVGGAYTIKSRSRGQEIVLERRESAYMHEGKQVRDKPYFKTIRFRIRPDDSAALLSLKAGDLDEMILTPELWQNQTNGDEFYNRNTKVYDTEWTEFHFLWNLKDPRFQDKRVRKALALAFDHKELLSKLLFGLCEPCTGPYHPTSRWSPTPAPEPIERDLDQAENLLDEAGWADSNNDGVRDKVVDGRRIDFEFTVLCTNAPLRIDICDLLKESLQQIGIQVNVKPLEFAAVIDKMTNKDFQAAFGGWGTGTDPDTSENVFATGQERNYGSYSNPEVDKLFEQGRKEFDTDKRQAIYQKIATLMWEDQPYCWLYYRNAFYGFSKDLRGYMFSPRGPYHYGPGFSSIYKPAQP